MTSANAAVTSFLKNLMLPSICSIAISVKIRAGCRGSRAFVEKRRHLLFACDQRLQPIGRRRELALHDHVSRVRDARAVEIRILRPLPDDVVGEDARVHRVNQLLAVELPVGRQRRRDRWPSAAAEKPSSAVALGSNGRSARHRPSRASYLWTPRSVAALGWRRKLSSRMLGSQRAERGIARAGSRCRRRRRRFAAPTLRQDQPRRVAGRARADARGATHVFSQGLPMWTTSAASLLRRLVRFDAGVVQASRPAGNGGPEGPHYT